MPAIEPGFGAEHVHRAALAPGVAVGPPREFRHHAVGGHAAGKHVAVVAIGGDDRITFAEGRLHADHHRFLADIEMAEATDHAHPVELAGLFLEAPDAQHQAVMREQVDAGRCGGLFLARTRGPRAFAGCGFACGHTRPPRAKVVTGTVPR